MGPQERQLRTNYDMYEMKEASTFLSEMKKFYSRGGLNKNELCYKTFVCVINVR